MLTAGSLLALILVISLVAVGVKQFTRSDYYPVHKPGTSPYDEGRERGDWLTDDEFDENGIIVTRIHGEAVYHPVNTLWFIHRMLDSYLVSHDATYLKYAQDNLDYLTDGSTLDNTGRWYTYQFNHSPGGLEMSVPWVSSMAQGMALSANSRMFEITGAQRYRDVADEIFKTYSAPKGSPFWFVNHDGCAWKTPCTYLEEYPAVRDEQNAHVVNGHYYSAWGLYDYYNVTDNKDAARMFQESVETMARSFEQYRRENAPSYYAVTEVGHEIWGAPENYHIGVAHQLEVTATLTNSQTLKKQSEILMSDFSG